MRIDTLGRRSRFERSPRDKTIVSTERDLAVFEAIHRHGPLPSNYLYEFAGQKNEQHFKRRLTTMYHGLTDGTYFLERPDQQYQSCLAKSQRAIYDLAPAAKVLLAEAGLLSPYIGERADHFLHRFMAACVSASFELGCKKAGIRYIGRHEIFSHVKCPDQTRNASNPLALPVNGKNLIPDDLFGIDYGGKYRFFAVEIDRNTESIERKNFDQNAFGKKLKGYLEVLDSRNFKSVWGIPNLLVLTITTNATHMGNIMAYLSRISNGDNEKFLFKAKPKFGINWIVPPVMTDLISEKWARTSTAFDIGAT